MKPWRCRLCTRIISWPANYCAEHDPDARQESLFSAPRPGDVRRSDPLPSRRAAAANLVARQTQKAEILKRLLDGPQTSRSVADVTGGQVSRASKRLGELRDAGLARPVGYEQQPGGGTPVTVFRITDEGRRDVQAMTGAAS